MPAMAEPAVNRPARARPTAAVESFVSAFTVSSLTRWGDRRPVHSNKTRPRAGVRAATSPAGLRTAEPSPGHRRRNDGGSPFIKDDRVPRSVTGGPGRSRCRTEGGRSGRAVRGGAVRTDLAEIGKRRLPQTAPLGDLVLVQDLLRRLLERRGVEHDLGARRVRLEDDSVEV